MTKFLSPTDVEGVAREVYSYLGETVDASLDSADDTGLFDIVEAELAAQAKVVRYPVGEYRDPAKPQPYPSGPGLTADLLEALCRRVARNRALRNLPLGFDVAMSDNAVATTRIGQDPEVRRLEAPYRRLVLG